MLFFDRAFSKLFGGNFNLQFFRYTHWFEAFLCLLIGDGGGVTVKGRNLHIKVAVGCPFESKVLTHNNCCWRSFWNVRYLHIRITVGGLLKARCLYITVAVGGLLQSDYLHITDSLNPFN